jgi:hypothetical protein
MTEKEQRYAYDGKLMEDVTIGGFQNMLNEYCKTKINGGRKRDCGKCIFSPDSNCAGQDCDDFITSDLPRAAYMLYQAKNKKTDKHSDADIAKDNIIKLMHDASSTDPQALTAVEYFKMLDEMRNEDFIDEEVECETDSTEDMIKFVITRYEEFKAPKELTFFDKFIDDNNITSSEAIMQIKGMCNDGAICRDKVFDTNQDGDVNWCKYIDKPEDGQCKDCWNEKYNEDMYTMYD